MKNSNNERIFLKFLRGILKALGLKILKRKLKLLQIFLNHKKLYMEKPTFKNLSV